MAWERVQTSAYPMAMPHASTPHLLYVNRVMYLYPKYVVVNAYVMSVIFEVGKKRRKEHYFGAPSCHYARSGISSSPAFFFSCTFLMRVNWTIEWLVKQIIQNSLLDRSSWFRNILLMSHADPGHQIRFFPSISICNIFILMGFTVDFSRREKL